ncbi:MAG: aa3-type cytochrome c oxidase subunit IV [Alteraurantiacibacter sp.]
MSNPHPQDIKAAKGTYDSFIGMLKWSVPLIAVIALFVVILIA